MTTTFISSACCGGIHAKNIELDERWESTVDAQQAVIVLPGYRINLTEAAAKKLHQMLEDHFSAQQWAAEQDED